MDTRLQDNPPGATAAEDGSDNHLRLSTSNPEWKDAIASWEDGNTYVFKEVQVRQVSPGEFQVISATPEAEAATGESEGAPAAGGNSPGAMEGGADEGEANPAIRRLMAQQKA